MYSLVTYQNIDYGLVSCHLKEIMQDRKVSIYKLSSASNIKYEVIKRYYDDNVLRYDADILAKLCFCLDCDLSSLLKYEK